MKKKKKKKKKRELVMKNSGLTDFSIWVQAQLGLRPIQLK
jgi:hypothetical protein